MTGSPAGGRYSGDRRSSGRRKGIGHMNYLAP